MKPSRGLLTRVILQLAGLTGFAGAAVAPLEAQTISAQVISADTVASAASLTNSPTTYVVSLQVTVSGCSKAGSTDCQAYLWATTAGTQVTNLRWSTTSATCATSRAIGTANPAATNNTADRVLLVAAPATGNAAPTSGSATVYVCHDATLSWSTAPTRFPYTLNFVVTRW